MNERTPVLVLGLGNVVCTDDGAGIAAIHKLMREYDLPEGVLALDGGTLDGGSVLGSGVMQWIESRDASAWIWIAVGAAIVVTATWMTRRRRLGSTSAP